MQVSLIRRHLIGWLLLGPAVIGYGPADALVPAQGIGTCLLCCCATARTLPHHPLLTCGSAAPSAGWSWTSAGSAGRAAPWAAATWWSGSRDPRRRSGRGCRCGPPSLQDTRTSHEIGRRKGRLPKACHDITKGGHHVGLKEENTDCYSLTSLVKKNNKRERQPAQLCERVVQSEVILRLNSRGRQEITDLHQNQ